MQLTPRRKNFKASQRPRPPCAFLTSTEANLGDGLFDTARFFESNGRLCIGSDSQSTRESG